MDKALRRWRRYAWLSAVGAAVSLAAAAFSVGPALERNWGVFWGVCALANAAILGYSLYRCRR